MIRVCPHSDAECSHGMSGATGQYNGLKVLVEQKPLDASQHDPEPVKTHDNEELVLIVAKMINPTAFNSYYHLFEYCLIKGDNEESAMETANYFHKESCDNAIKLATKIINLIQDTE